MTVFFRVTQVLLLLFTYISKTRNLNGNFRLSMIIFSTEHWSFHRFIIKWCIVLYQAASRILTEFLQLSNQLSYTSFHPQLTEKEKKWLLSIEITQVPKWCVSISGIFLTAILCPKKRILMQSLLKVSTTRYIKCSARNYSMKKGRLFNESKR